ncbi:MAG: ASCH domain-containing protein [Tepidisphaeraceae bacterium]
MLALSIRQPFAELILRGLKTMEYRSQPTRILGERFLIYASKRRTKIADNDWLRGPIISDNLAAVTPPPWMTELAKGMSLFGPDFAELPTGMIVGSAVIEKVTPINQPGMFAWHLADVKREAVRSPKGRPQPVWWRETE